MVAIARLTKIRRRSWWKSLIVAGLLAPVSMSAQVTSKAKEPRTIQSDLWEVRIIGHQDRPHSILSHITVREYVFEATPRGGGEARHVRVGGDFLEALQPLKEIRIFENLLVVTTHIHILVLDLQSGVNLKFLRVLDPTFSPSGRFLAYREWQLRWMPKEMHGGVVSVLDLQTLERRVVFPESKNVKEFRRADPSDEFEPYFTVWEEDPRQRCFTSKLPWSHDDSRLAFICHYYLAEEGRHSGRHDLQKYEMIVVYLSMDLEATTPHPELEDSSFVRFDIPRESFLLPGVELPARGSLFRVDGIEWHDHRFLEIRMDARWSRKKIFLDTEQNEIRNDLETD